MRDTSVIKKELIFALLLLMIGTALAQTIPSSERIEVTLINQEPDPVAPGEQVKLKFRVENSGSETAEDVQVELLEVYPFTLVESAIKSIGSVAGRQTGTAGVTVEYKLKVDEDAPEGDHEVRLRYRIKQREWVLPEEFDVRIESADAFISIENVETMPPIITPGQTASLRFELKNLVTSLLKDVEISLDFSSDDTPFVPVQSATLKKLTRIDAGSRGEISFQITALPSASAGTYKVPITLSYADELNNQYTKSGIIGLRVGSEPDLALVIDETSITGPGQIGDVTIKIVNKGLSDVKLMNTRLIETEQYSILSAEEEYLGNIDSDDYETADFKISVSKESEGDIMLKVMLEYMDANNVRYSEEREVGIKVLSSAEAKSLGKARGGVAGYVITVLIVIAGVIAYRWYRKRKKRKK